MKKTIVTIVALAFGLLFIGSIFAKGQTETSASSTAGKTHLAVVLRSLSNPYQIEYVKGAKQLGKSLGLPVDTLVSNGDSQKELSDIKAEVARTGGNVVFYIDPNQATDVVAIANILDQAHVYFQIWWNKPNDVHVWDYPYWTTFISFDGVAAGEFTANELFKSLPTPYKGKIIAIQGLLSNTPAQERFQGLKNELAKYPGVQLVQWQAGDWLRTKAYDETKAMLVAHPDIGGVWCANDDMAMGALQALKEAGLAGKVKVTGTDGIPEMFKALEDGLAAATVVSPGGLQAELGLSMALAAKEGKLDFNTLPHKYRSFEMPAINVPPADAKKIYSEYVENIPLYHFTPDNFFKNWSKALP